MNPSRIRRSSLIAAAVACCFLPEAALANPVGPKVVHGNASFNQQGKQLTVTNSPGSIINWQGFSIAAGETTRFVQQNATSAVLNRVVGADPSAILGALHSNGRVWLVNPNGILIGKGAQIDTAGLIASTLNVMNADFLLGRMRFVDTPGAKEISNAGEIRTPVGGRVVLISPQGVENSGIIHSPLGEVILAAGKTIEIVDSANPEVRIEIAAPAARAVNLGKIVAQSGKVGIYGGIVVNRGLVSADSAVVGENGKIVFRATRDASLEAGSVTTASGSQGGSIEVQSGGTSLVSGAVQATGSAGAGGQVSILGQQVGVIDQASIDVSGSRGGGTVLVGGDLRGENPNVRNAQMTFVGSDTGIKADALGAGDGGKVIVWADDTTRSHGSISARGGPLGGDGGFVETSGKLNLSVTRGPDVRAPAGKSGTWLIDPNNIEIVPGQVFDATTNTGAPFFSPLADGSQIGVDLINAQLDFGSNVVINTTSRGASVGADPGNITLSALIKKTAATVAGGPVIGTTSLTFQAHNDIVVNPTGGIASTGDRLNVSLIANFDNTGGGALTLGGPITTNGGTVALQARDLIQVNAPIHTLNANGIGGGTVTVTSTAGAVGLGSTITAGSNVFVTGNAGANVTGPVTGSFFSGSSTTGPFVVAANITTTGGMNVSAFGFTVASGAAINTGFGGFTVTDTSPSTVHIQSGASIASSGATITSNGMQFDGNLNAGAGTVTLRQNTAGTPFALGAEAAGAVALTGAEMSRVSTTGGLFIGNASTGAITASGPVNFAGMSQVSITTGSSFTQNAGATITSSAPMTLNAPTGITLDAASSAPRFTFIANRFAPNQPVTSGSDIDVRTTSSATAINLGATPSGNSLDMTAGQVDNLITSASGKVRIGTTSSGMLTIKGSIAPTGTSTLVLGSGISITEESGATITVANLGLNVIGPVDLAQHNRVGTLASNQCCAGDKFTFHNAPNTPLAIGTVDAISGLSNFNSDATTIVYVDADNLSIGAPVQFPDAKVYVKPTSASTRIDIGGADAAGVLGFSAAEFALITAGKFVICADIADITAAIVASGVSTFAVQPVTMGRTVNIVSGAKNLANLEFVQFDIGNVTASTFLLGGKNAGPVNVNAAVTVPATIGTFALESPNATTGITVNNAISATNSVSLIGEVMTLNALTMSSAGSLTVANSSAGRMVELGNRTAGKLALSTAEAQTQLSAPAGTLTFGSGTAGNLDVTSTLSFANAASVALVSGGTATVGLSQSVAANGSLTISAPTITLNGAISSAAGGITLMGDRMNVANTVSAPMGDVTAHPLNFRSVDLGTDDTGSTLGFTPTEINNFMPGTGRVLRFGDVGNTNNVTVRAAIAPANATTLSLVTNSGTVTQTAGSTIDVSSLAVRANGNITLDQNNDTDTFAAQSNFGNVSITYFGTNPLNIGTVDGVTGVSTSGGNITLRSDLLNINNRVDSFAGNVTITALSPNQPLTIGTKSGAPGLLNSELDLIGATTLNLGDPVAANTGNVSVTAPVNITGGVQNLTITTSPTATVAVSNPLTVPGTITINTGTLNTTAALMATGGAINAIADAMTFGATATAGGQAITLRPRTAGTMVAVGGADSASPLTLGIDATEIPNLLYGAGTLTIGSTTAGDMNVTFAGMLPGSVALATGGQATFNSSTFSATNALNITANKMSIPGANGIAANDGVSITTATAGRNMTIGTVPGVANDFELSAAEAGKISIGGTGTLQLNTTGTLTTTAPLAFTMVPNVGLSAGTLVHTGGALSAPGAITLRANNMPSAGFSTVTSTGGGRITIAPQTLRAVNAGTNPAGAALGLAASQLAQVFTSGVVQIGDPSFTSSITVSAPISQPAGSSALALISAGAISQAANAAITATSLRLQAGSAVTLTAANTIGTVAGSSAGSFSLTSTGTTVIATVDGQSGINDSTITVLSDGIGISSPVIGGTTTFAPRLPGTAINLGSGSGYVLTDAMVDMITGFTLNIGNNTSGPISVNSTVDRSSGSLVLTTAPGSAIMVNAPLGSATTSSVTMNTGAGGTVAIGGPVLASSAISATGRNISVDAPVTSNFSNVTLGAAAGDTGSSITVNQPIKAGNSITLTADAQTIAAALTAAFQATLQPRTSGTMVTVGGSIPGTLSVPSSALALINADQVIIGNNTAGDLTVVSAIGPFQFDGLTLASGSNVTQTPGSTITVKNTSPTGVVTGSLTVNAGGLINLPELNNVAVSVSGNAGGTGNNFQFNNEAPLKLQNVTGVFASGKVIINSPPGDLVLTPPTPTPTPTPTPPPPLPETSATQAAANTAQDSILGAIEEAENVQLKSDKAADERKAEGEKKEAEQDKEEGRTSCG